MSKLARYCALVVIALVFSVGPSASAKGRGGSSRSRSSNWGGRKMGNIRDRPSYNTNQRNNWRSPELDKAEKVEKKVEKNSARPPGWDKGKKKGWDTDVPPGIEKKDGRLPPGLNNMEQAKPKDGTSPGWSQGEKKGWEGADTPPKKKKHSHHPAKSSE